MKYKFDIQFFGGRGSSSSGGASGGLDPSDIVSTTSLISEREGKEREVDETLNVLRDVMKDYGVDLEDVRVATLKGKGNATMAYYDAGGNLAVNKKYFDSKKMNDAYDACVDSGFHPSRGNKTGMEAVVAHEMGHRLNHIAGGNSWEKLDSTAYDIVKKASKATGYKNATKEFSAKISGYAKQSYAEAVAEAFADVYCNGKKASRESRAVVSELNKYFKK